MCEIHEKDTPDHILFRCEALAQVRDHRISKLHGLLPHAMIACLNDMSDEGKLLILVTGLHCDRLIDEWIPILISISSYIYAIYVKRKQMYDRMLNAM